MKVGYNFWGFLGDKKYSKDGELLSTPDGNAFYSWSIIKELLKRGCKVFNMMPDRDFPGICIEKENLFSSWCQNDRLNSYLGQIFTFDYKLKTKSFCNITKQDLFDVWDDFEVYNFDFILHEWRMEIPGRNDLESRYEWKWQPDLFIQQCVLEYCRLHNITLIIFDLDYKFNENEVSLGDNIHVFELGNKFSGKEWADKVYIPFDFSCIDEFEPKLYNFDDYSNNLVYIGNRYERDWCIDKYIPTEMKNVIVYGNWKESGRDSEKRWPNIKFGDRLQTSDMYDVYSNSIATILLAKKDYCENQFMTARIIEAIFYCTVPLFIEEYGDDCILDYAGAYSKLLTVRSKGDVIDVVYKLKHNSLLRHNIIYYLRKRLSKFMDVKFFVDKCFSVLVKKGEANNDLQ